MEMAVFNLDDAPLISNIPCIIFSQPEYEGSLDISCDSSGLSGVSCTSASPIDIAKGADQTNITVTVNISASAIAGERGDILVSAVDSDFNVNKTSLIQVLIIQGGGPQSANYDPDVGAPRCFAEGSSVRNHAVTYNHLDT